MTKNEVKCWVKNKIDSCIIIQDEKFKDWFDLCYNEQYLNALELTEKNGKCVDPEYFKGGVHLFCINVKTKKFYHYSIVENYLIKNYSEIYSERKSLIKEIINDYVDYVDYVVR